MVFIKNGKKKDKGENKQINKNENNKRIYKKLICKINNAVNR